MNDCLFCKFASGEIFVNKVYEDEFFFIIRDIAPMAKNHYLAIPKIHFKFLLDMDEQGANVVKHIFKTIPTLSKLLELDGGYRLVINQGDNAGQTVPHLHIHILCGQKMGWTPA